MTSRCKAGYAVVYVLGTPSGPCKVGITGRPQHRAREILSQCPGAVHGNGATMTYLSAPFPRSFAAAVEQAAHKVLAKSACDQTYAGWGARRWRTDWFKVPADHARAAIQGAMHAAGVEFIPENGGGAGVRLRKPDAEGRK